MSQPEVEHVLYILTCQILEDLYIELAQQEVLMAHTAAIYKTIVVVRTWPMRSKQEIPARCNWLITMTQVRRKEFEKLRAEIL